MSQMPSLQVPYHCGATVLLQHEVTGTDPSHRHYRLHLAAWLKALNSDAAVAAVLQYEVHHHGLGCAAREDAGWPQAAWYMHGQVRQGCCALCWHLTPAVQQQACTFLQQACTWI